MTPVVRSRDCSRSHALAKIRKNQGESAAVPTATTEASLARRRILGAATALWHSGQSTPRTSKTMLPSRFTSDTSAPRKNHRCCVQVKSNYGGLTLAHEATQSEACVGKNLSRASYLHTSPGYLGPSFIDIRREALGWGVSTGDRNGCLA